MKDLLTTAQVAEIIGVSDSRIRQFVMRGQLPAKKFGNTNLIKREDIKLIDTRVHGRPKKEKAA